MSSGSFTRSRYETDAGDVHPIRVQPETLELVAGSNTNTATTATITSSISAKVSRGNRGFGVRARAIAIRFDTAPTEYKQDSIIVVPILRQSVYDAINNGSAVTYQGTAATVVYKRPEKIG